MAEPAQGGSGGERRRRVRAKKALSDDAYQKLLTSAQAFEKPKKASADRSREAAIVDALLSRGASVAEAVQFCVDGGLKVSRRFVEQRKASGGGSGSGAPGGGAGRPGGFEP